MNSAHGERITIVLGERRHRRGVLSLFGAAVLAGVGAAASGGGSANAGRRGKGGDRCKPGKALDRVQVPADGSAVTTKRLEKGQSYRLHVSGVIEDNEWGIDGEYYFLLADPENRSEVYDECFDETAVGVEVAGAEFSGWGEYDPDHVYERKVTGKGKPLSLRLSDCFYPGHTGSLKVEVLCG